MKWELIKTIWNLCSGVASILLIFISAWHAWHGNWGEATYLLVLVVAARMKWDSNRK